MKPLKIAIVASNMYRIHKGIRKGTELFVYHFVRHLSRMIDAEHLPIQITVFASGDSELPVPIVSVRHLSSREDKELLPDNYQQYEMALFSKACAMQDQFDLFHIHVSNGEWLMPFAPFVKKPMVVTMHGGVANAYDPLFFSLFQNQKNLVFVSISDSQRKKLPGVSYGATIHHGINTDGIFAFHENGGESVMWAGRASPEKGADIVVDVLSRVKKPGVLCTIRNTLHTAWFEREVIEKIQTITSKEAVSVVFDVKQFDLIPHYQNSKLFLFPVQWEEPFGMVMAESLACGTPVVAFARGAATEIIDDGKTGFLVNPSESDVRGNYLIKKTGVSGLVEAVERVYALTKEQYREMRYASRERAVAMFSQAQMVRNYINLYTKLTDTSITQI